MKRKLPQWLEDFRCEEVLCFMPHSLYAIAFENCVNNNLLYKNKSILSEIVKRLPSFDVVVSQYSVISIEPHDVIISEELSVKSSTDEFFISSQSFWVKSIALIQEPHTCKRSELKIDEQKRRGFSCKRQLFK